MNQPLFAGAASSDITPTKSLHLFGYPHVERYSTGVHDPLMASACYLRGDKGETIFVAVDIIFVPKRLVANARERIATATGVSAENILISATHTHSGPGTVRYASNEADSTVPTPDEDYLRQLEDGIVEAACRSVEMKEPAELGLALANGACVGTNRRDPAGPSHPDVPVLMVRAKDSKTYIAAMLICSMHPTVLHEDSTLISGDFPGLTRQYLQQHALGESCVVLHHSGASGNQSPRHVIRGTTFAEAARLGEELGKAVAAAIANIDYIDSASIQCRRTELDLPMRTFPPETAARENLARTNARFKLLQDAGAPGPEIRTAECDVFGAEETLTLSRAAANRKLQAYAETCMPAEVQAISVGPWNFLALPGELFVEFALEIEANHPDTHVITLANGELQGYLVTEEALHEGGYEASNALFKSPDSGRILVHAAHDLLNAFPARTAESS